MAKFETENWPYVPARKQIPWTNPRPVRLIVIHATQSKELATGAEANASWFQNPAAGGSAHVVVDSDSVVQCVRDNNEAAGAPGANKDGIHIELVGYAEQSSKEWMDIYGTLLLERAANVVAQYVMKYGISAVHLSNDELKAGAKGIVGHYQVSAVYKKSTHTDPGKDFPWIFFMERVNVQVERYKAIALEAAKHP